MVLDLTQFIKDNDLHGLEGDLEMLARYQGWLMSYTIYNVPKLHIDCWFILINNQNLGNNNELSKQLNFGLNLFIQEQGL